MTQGLAFDVQPRFSPDGREVSFTSDRGGGNNIWRMALAGGEPVAVTSEDFRSDQQCRVDAGWRLPDRA
jgi:Tol biopolymer transport system component